LGEWRWVAELSNNLFTISLLLLRDSFQRLLHAAGVQLREIFLDQQLRSKIYQLTWHISEILFLYIMPHRSWMPWGAKKNPVRTGFVPKAASCGSTPIANWWRSGDAWKPLLRR
jgi:hypothetical protein